ncbi:unnamed protein product, partial [Vicia faba]
HILIHITHTPTHVTYQTHRHTLTHVRHQTRRYMSCITPYFWGNLNTNYKHIYFNTKEGGAIATFSCPIQEKYHSYIVHSFTQYNTIHTVPAKVLLHFKTNQGKRVFITQKYHNNYKRIRKLQTRPNTCCGTRHLLKQICTQGSSFYVYSKIDDDS